MPKKLLIILGIVVIVFATVIYLNNRDYYSDVSNPSTKTAEKPDESPKSNEKSARGDRLADSSKLKPRANVGSKDSVKTVNSVVTVDSSKNTKNQTAVSKRVLKVPVDSGKSDSESRRVSVPTQKPVFSQEIRVLDCVISSRPDIRLNLEFEAIYEDKKAKAEILIRKNDIQTIVKSVLKNKELGDIKKESLQKELVEAINGIFEMNLLTEVKFRSFHIEKVK